MIDAELRRYVDKIIENKLNIILNGVTGNTTITTETINQMFPGQDGIKDRPIMHPFGFVSRAKQGSLSVVARMGEHPGNRIILGHRDKDRPPVAEGEAAVYSRDGYAVRVENGKIQVGKGDLFQTVVMGEDLEAVLIAMLEAIIAHTHLGNLGFQTSAPLNAATFQEIQTEQVEDGKLLAKEGGKF